MAIGQAASVDFTSTLPARPGLGRRLSAAARRKPLGVLGIMVLALVVVCAVFGPGVSVDGKTVVPGFAPYNPNKTHPLNVEASPSSTHWLGTDTVGRDVFSRLVYGARPSLIVGIVATGLGVFVGTVIGLYSGYTRGFTDLIVQRFVDAVMSFPPLILLMALVSIVPASITTIVLVLVVFIAPSTSRVIRGAVIGVMSSAYIESARAIGAGNVRIALRHVIPNIFAPVMVMVSTIIGGLWAYCSVPRGWRSRPASPSPSRYWPSTSWEMPFATSWIPVCGV
jgi:peptide/nickel transport system permease protein